MPISIVVGGQFGSEGKGKVALEIARRSILPTTLVRVGGPNSGHTGYDKSGKRFALRQLPAGCIDRNVDVVFPAGSYIDIEVLFAEIRELGFSKSRIKISPYANVITQEHRNWEADGNLGKSIGSTGSGVGGAVMAAVAREAKNFGLRCEHASLHQPLEQFICDTTELLSVRLVKKHRVIIEGSQGFGLSLLDGGYWPKATSRSTTASAALAEAGLSPLDVDDVTLVIRSFPIRVAGECSGPLTEETSWEEIATNAGHDSDLREYTTVTKKLRRVGKFEANPVCRAIAANNPNRIVMNHLDYIGDKNELSNPKSKICAFVSEVQDKIGRNIDWYGFSALDVLEAESATV